jgi:hypothetical protein
MDFRPFVLAAQKTVWKAERFRLYDRSAVDSIKPNGSPIGGRNGPELSRPTPHRFLSLSMSAYGRKDPLRALKHMTDNGIAVIIRTERISCGFLPEGRIP